jgi:hypothetical protein
VCKEAVFLEYASLALSDRGHWPEYRDLDVGFHTHYGGLGKQPALGYTVCGILFFLFENCIFTIYSHLLRSNK